MWPQTREDTGSDTAVGNFPFHPLLFSSLSIKELQLDKGFEPKAISVLLRIVLPGNMRRGGAAGLRRGAGMTWGFGDMS